MAINFSISRYAYIVFPFIDRLPGHAKFRAESLLGHALFLPLLCNSISKGHGHRLLPEKVYQSMLHDATNYGIFFC